MHFFLYSVILFLGEPRSRKGTDSHAVLHRTITQIKEFFMGKAIAIILPFLIAAAIFTLAGTIWYFYRKAKKTMKDLFGTDDLKELAQTREKLEEETPKSVSGMTSLYVPLIQKDFPELNWIQLKAMAEKHLLEYVAKEGFTAPHIYKTAILNYIKKSGTCVVVFQTGLHYFLNEKKIQTRCNTHMIYIQDADKYGHDKGFSVTCPHCGGVLTALGAKYCEYCGSEVIPINIHVWQLDKIENLGNS